MDLPQPPAVDFTGLTADIISAYVTKNSVRSADLPVLITSVHAALQGLVAPKQPKAEKPQPAVSIRKSVTPDFIYSLEDGKPYRTLKRHLTGQGLTPDAYREKWGLPQDYPMVASNYAKRRSELAKSAGLGQLRGRHAAAKSAAQDAVSASGEATKPKRRAPAKKGE
ncbi:MucR family transcriptional regulator [Microvirga alba]|uniref:MucR family transcriptional regulator n=1 Tax=Microvirga alba TaxID=2791025 RepID=A0A931FU74_9HYPH|nr:MucR family transcriptional regulator [Microvirga alba]MBF9235356.1 MucR family transcriptional regulator [Microvirga alba]